MSVKTGFFIFLISLTAIASVTAHETVRTAGIITGERDRDSKNLSATEDDGLRFWGLETETIGSDDTGFGMDALVNFYTDELNYSMLDWQGQLYMRYHLFGAQSFLDPFVEAGIGNAGTVRLEDGEELEMSLYPFLSAGGNLLFHGGFYAGIRWSYRFDQWIIPGTVIPQPELDKHQVSFTVGYSYSWHDRHHHDNHYHYHFD